MSQQSASHTPGPWVVGATSPCGGYREIDAPNAQYPWEGFATVVVRMEGDAADYPQGLANARLIAAAPDLLEALMTVLQVKRTDDRSIVFAPDAVAKARAAISKATGEAR